MYVFQMSFQYILWIPGLTLALKVPLLIPPVDWYLTKIRSGWTRGTSRTRQQSMEKIHFLVHLASEI